LAEIHRASGRPKDALALLEPLTRILGQTQLSPEQAEQAAALLTIQLRAHIADGQADKAISDMKALEGIRGAGGSRTQLYLELSLMLKTELEAEQKKAYTTNLNKIRDAYAQFIQALADSKTGQTYDSLRFAGEQLLMLGRAPEADKIFDRILADPTLTKGTTPQERNKMLIVRLRKVEALRKQGRFDEAESNLRAVRDEAKTMLEPALEQGYLYEDWAKKDSSKWNAAYTHWNWMAGQLAKRRPRPVEYYDAVYHVARSLQGMGRKSEAAGTLKSVMTLSPHVGSPEMKKKYDTLLAELNR
jgi:tetratricopeptide (TPR) repeat protein